MKRDRLPLSNPVWMEFIRRLENHSAAVKKEIDRVQGTIRFLDGKKREIIGNSLQSIAANYLVYMKRLRDFKINSNEMIRSTDLRKAVTDQLALSRDFRYLLQWVFNEPLRPSLLARILRGRLDESRLILNLAEGVSKWYHNLLPVDRSSAYPNVIFVSSYVYQHASTVNIIRMPTADSLESLFWPSICHETFSARILVLVRNYLQGREVRMEDAQRLRVLSDAYVKLVKSLDRFNSSNVLLGDSDWFFSEGYSANQSLKLVCDVATAMLSGPADLYSCSVFWADYLRSSCRGLSEYVANPSYPPFCARIRCIYQTLEELGHASSIVSWNDHLKDIIGFDDEVNAGAPDFRTHCKKYARTVGRNVPALVQGLRELVKPFNDKELNKTREMYSSAKGDFKRISSVDNPAVVFNLAWLRRQDLYRSAQERKLEWPFDGPEARKEAIDQRDILFLLRALPTKD